MLMSLVVLGSEKGCAGYDQQKNCKRIRLIVREDAPRQQIRNCLKILKERRGKNWSRVPDGCLTPRQTDRLTVGRNIVLALTL
jgi:hypothetical protein